MKLRMKDGAANFTVSAGFWGPFHAEDGWIEVPDDFPVTSFYELEVIEEDGGPWLVESAAEDEPEAEAPAPKDDGAAEEDNE